MCTGADPPVVPQELTYDLPLFLGAMLAAICLAAAALVCAVALPRSPTLALAYGFAALGVTFLGIGTVGAAVVGYLGD